ncbi:hypothetical protein DDV21_005430 [Streptococcus chenjunshii]|uniref:Uncharacterized protein n=1 Tax=Streptococcus chenjunshii TaxID=2173853 RepID=A0A372KPE7_9STRE|nr:hypothetical protein [Streptococcus chenjunshii]AXQ78560.1 hypothetical protein DDV21_005430 [Streptococcus chenjunshii]RFU51978.1 hypothetical protein DDV22_00615 [Streptococcus chenjunshii]RFU54170.1 hypothetical protein DDV23_01170 [Streptococcus chenjunshii]
MMSYIYYCFIKKKWFEKIFPSILKPVTFLQFIKFLVIYIFIFILFPLLFRFTAVHLIFNTSSLVLKIIQLIILVDCLILTGVTYLSLFLLISSCLFIELPQKGSLIKRLLLTKETSEDFTNEKFNSKIKNVE